MEEVKNGRSGASETSLSVTESMFRTTNNSGTTKC